MLFDQDNTIMKLCATGMNLEGEGKQKEAKAIFTRAWKEAGDHLEKFTAAHYLARHQYTVADKLKWDQKALAHARRINSPEIKSTYPSLYLNIAKCYEDLNDHHTALKYYNAGFAHTRFLKEDGYGLLIKGGLMNGIKRVSPSPENS